MKKSLLFFSFCTILNIKSFAQRLECIAAVNYNIFHSINITGSNTHSPAQQDYKSGYGYAFSMGIDEIKINKTPFRFTLKYDHYTGGASYYYSGLGGGKQYDLNVKKDLLGLGIYPINVSFFQSLKLSIGAEFNFLIYSQQNGNQSFWHLTPNGPNPFVTSNTTIDNNSQNINQAFNFGINTSLRYEFSISENWRIAPQAMLYLSMTNEFNSSFESSNCLRTYLGIAIIKNLRKSI